MDELEGSRYISDHDKTRIARLTQNRGRYQNCRFYSPVTDRVFYCTKQGSAKKTCEGCHTCPNCSGIMFTYRVSVSNHRDRRYIDHAKSCAICGAYIEESYVVMLNEPPVIPQGDGCQVHGCQDTAYEGFHHTENCDGQTQQFRICLTHKRRMKTWRLHPGKGEDQKPILLVAGKLVDNVAYSKKQGKHKKEGDTSK